MMRRFLKHVCAKQLHPSGDVVIAKLHRCIQVHHLQSLQLQNWVVDNALLQTKPHACTRHWSGDREVQVRILTSSLLRNNLRQADFHIVKRFISNAFKFQIKLQEAYAYDFATFDLFNLRYIGSLYVVFHCYRAWRLYGHLFCCI